MNRAIQSFYERRVERRTSHQRSLRSFSTCHQTGPTQAGSAAHDQSIRDRLSNLNGRVGHRSSIGFWVAIWSRTRCRLLWRFWYLGSITCFNGLPERLYSPLDLFMLPHKPVSGPNPMELPPQVFELLLAEPVPVSGSIAGVIRGTAIGPLRFWRLLSIHIRNYRPKYRRQSFHTSDDFPGSYTVHWNKSFDESSIVYKVGSYGLMSSMESLPNDTECDGILEVMPAPYQREAADTEHPDVLFYWRAA